MKGKVYIIGAGPGNYKLLTLRAVECIQNADVIVHDRLIDSKVLSFASDNASFIDVGKHPTYHQVPQKEINQILCELALQGKIVARVKGGDSFLFGRGGEECEALKEKGITYEVVPGVTSSIAVPAYAGIPVTHRSYASSVHIITGHKSPENEGKSFDLEVLSKVEGTLVFLMGVKNIEEICDGLIANGKKKDTPVAIIMQGGSANQRTLRGTLDQIVRIAKEEKVTSPAVIVIGAVASLMEKLQWFGQGVLSGKRIVVTRPVGQSKELVKELEELGATVIEFPVIKIEPISQNLALQAALSNIEDYSWLVFTSVNGVNHFFEYLRQNKIDQRILHGLKFAVVGAATKKVLEEKGIYADYVPESYTTAHLLNGMLPLLGNEDRLLLLRSEIAGNELSDGLHHHGIVFDDIPIYKTIVNQIEASPLMESINKGEVDYVIFTSPSTVHAFSSITGKALANKSGIKFICIGPVTEKAALEAGFMVAGVAEEYVMEGIVKKLLELNG